MEAVALGHPAAEFFFRADETMKERIRNIRKLPVSIPS
jgi:hypothetical protein